MVFICSLPYSVHLNLVLGQLNSHLLCHAGQTLFLLAAVDGSVIQERVKQILLLIEYGALPFVRGHGAPVGRRGHC